MTFETVALNLATLVRLFNSLLTSLCQLLALFVILIGVVRALLIFLKSTWLKPQTPEAFQNSRLAMGYSFSLGLGFLVGASILKTMISSRWDDIARLAAIIAVRTLLNFLLERAIGLSNPNQPVESLANSEISPAPTTSQR